MDAYIFQSHYNNPRTTLCDSKTVVVTTLDVDGNLYQKLLAGKEAVLEERKFVLQGKELGIWDYVSLH